MTTPLQDRLDAMSAASSGRIPEDKRAIMNRVTQDMIDRDLASQAKAVGDAAPSFSLEGARGATFQLESALAQGPVVLTWYRGNW